MPSKERDRRAEELKRKFNNWDWFNSIVSFNNYMLTLLKSDDDERQHNECRKQTFQIKSDYLLKAVSRSLFIFFRFCLAPYKKNVCWIKIRTEKKFRKEEKLLMWKGDQKKKWKWKVLLFLIRANESFFFDSFLMVEWR